MNLSTESNQSIDLRVWGCLVYALNTKAILVKDKIQMRGRPGIFIGLGQTGRFNASCRAVEVYFPQLTLLKLTTPGTVRSVRKSFPSRRCEL